MRLTLFTLHMKAFSDQQSYERRQEASQRLKNQLDFIYGSDAVVVLGDFNDELLASIRFGLESPYSNFVEDSQQYAFMTMPLETANTSTWCGNSPSCQGGSTIDHILISNQLFDAAGGASAMRYDSALFQTPSFVFTTSDHAPVVASLDFSRSTAIEEGNFVASMDWSAFPDPATDHIVVRLASQGAAQFAFFDVMGRRVLSGMLPSNGKPIDVSRLAGGTYLLRINTGRGAGAGRPITIVR